MAKYTVKFSCGHVETVRLYGSVSECKRKIKDLEENGLCSECYAKLQDEQRAAYVAREREEAALARAQLTDITLPELVGSEKQKIWADDIRAKQLHEMYTHKISIFCVLGTYLEHKKIYSVNRWKPDSECTKSIDETISMIPDEKQDRKMILISANRHMLRFLEQMTNICSAQEWIENRTNSLDDTLHEYIVRTNFSEPITESTSICSCYESEHPNEQKTESQIVKGENCNEPGIVQIRATSDEITIKYAKNENFRLCVKSHGYVWDSTRYVWYKELSVLTGNPTDRIAEVGHALLLKGFAVMIEDDAARDKAISGEYDPEQKRWVYVREIDNTECIVIGINFGENDLYNSARRIKGAKWKTRLGMIVPAERYDEIRDFAEHNKYSISPGAEAALTAAETLQNSIPVVKVSERKPEEPAESDTLKETLETPVEVIDDLRDED